MPRSFQKRRGKPRIEFQVGDDVPHRDAKSILQRKARQNDDEKNGPRELTEEELQTRMWKHVECTKEKPCSAPVARTSFSVRFPESREDYLRSCHKGIRSRMEHWGIAVEIDWDNSAISVATTQKTWDPYAVVKARDVIRLLARFVPLEQAIRAMGDDVLSDIIETGKMQGASSQLRFIKRRARLVGPNGVTLRAIELLTGCYVLVYGRSVCAIGGAKGVRQVRRIVQQCLRNVHPIYELKRLMVAKELAKNDKLKDANWKRFLPEFKKKRHFGSKVGAANNATGGSGKIESRKQSAIVKKKKKSIADIKKKLRRKRNTKYTPWPKPPVPSKVDIALETGEYWSREWRDKNLRRKSKEQLEDEKDASDAKNLDAEKRSFKEKRKAKRKAMKKAAFVAPKELDHTSKSRFADSAMIDQSQVARKIQSKLAFDSKKSTDISSFLLQ